MKKCVKNRYLDYFAVDLFAMLTVFFFFPMEVYMSNIYEFNFTIKHVWWILLSAASVSSLLVLFVELALSRISSRLSDGMAILLFVFTCCYYIQGLLLNNHVVSFVGELRWFERDVKLNNLLIWGALSGILLVGSLKSHRIRRLIPVASLALIVIQSAGFLSLLTTTPKKEPYKDLYFAKEGEFELSKQKNVVVFVLDFCDGLYVNQAMEKYPDMFDSFSGFCWYPDCISTYSRTYPSIPYLLTREQCWFDLPFGDYMAKAWEETSFLRDVKATGADIRLYTYNEYGGAAAKNFVDNCFFIDSSSFSILSPVNLIRKMVKISGYKGLPYCLKLRCYYTAGEINSSVIDFQSAEEGGFYYADDASFHNALKREKITVNDEYSAAFRFYHLWGTHPGAHLNAQGEDATDSSREEVLRGCLAIVETYMSYLRQLGLYDKTTIIVTTDHGRSTTQYVENDPGSDFQLDDAVTAFFMLKPEKAGQTDPFDVSDAPISHENYFATVMQAFDEDNDSYGVPVGAVRESDSFERYYYFTSLNSDEEGEIALREYRINGDARLFENWELTGRYWDILYSENKVSPKMLSDAL